jgi:large subunit ribosomal protein L21
MALFARSARRTLLESRTPLPPTYLPPLRAHITTVSHSLETGNVPEPLIRSGQHVSEALKEKVQSPPQLSHSAPAPANPEKRSAPHAIENVVATHITPTIRQLLPLLQTQPAHYITSHIHGHPYLLTKGDTIRLPFHMPNIRPGDVLRLNRATHIGSRDFTLKAPELIKGNADHTKKVFYLDERMFTCRARVVGVETEPMRVEEKTKRRQRHTKHVRSKMRFTVLRISDLEVKSLEEYEAIVRGQ